MPSPATLGSNERSLVINQQDVLSITIFVDPDGNGSVEIPVPNGGLIFGVPASALSVLATLKAHDLGFRIRFFSGGLFLGLIYGPGG
jgi:hypothetical protein